MTNWKIFMTGLCAAGTTFLSPAQNAVNSGAVAGGTPGRTAAQPLVIVGTNVLTPAQAVQFLNGSGGSSASGLQENRGMGIGQQGTGTSIGQQGTTSVTPPTLPPPVAVPTPDATSSSPNPALTPQGINPAITPQDIAPGQQDQSTLPPGTVQGQGLGIGQQGTGTTPGQQGAGTGTGQPGTTTIGPLGNQPAVGQQGATTLSPTTPGANLNPQLNPRIPSGTANSVNSGAGTGTFGSPGTGLNNNQSGSAVVPQGRNFGVAPGQQPGNSASQGAMNPRTSGKGSTTGGTGTTGTGGAGGAGGR